jgi:hypothetical protein
MSFVAKNILGINRDSGSKDISDGKDVREIGQNVKKIITTNLLLELLYSPSDNDFNKYALIVIKKALT